MSVTGVTHLTNKKIQQNIGAQDFAPRQLYINRLRILVVQFA